jgi:broad specificity phosphatase PhoE
MAYLILVRHSISKPNSQQSAHQWQLTPDGRERCLKLAEQLRLYQPTHFYSSDEPKAIDTAVLLMQALQINPEQLKTDVQFRETARENVPFFDRIEDFQSAIQKAMHHPDELHYGEETFNQALKRFSAGVKGVTDAHPDTTSVICSHGTILSLWIAKQIGQDAFSLWQSLDMPAYAVFRLPEMTLVDRVMSI